MSKIYTVKVICGAKQAGIESISNDELKVKLAVRPIQGRANKALKNVLAEYLGVKKSQVEIVSGQKSHWKRVKILK